MNKYTIVILPLDDEDGGGFLGFAPDLPGCMSDGENQPEALKNTQDAIAEWVELQKQRNVELPEPGSASEAAIQREEQLLDAIRSLAEYREQIEEENIGLKRKLAELIAVLKDNSSKNFPKIDLGKTISKLKPSRRH